MSNRPSLRFLPGPSRALQAEDERGRRVNARGDITVPVPVPAELQSGRFKETARQLGADKAGDNFDSILRALATVMPSLPPDLQLPTTSQLLGINPGGIAALANGSYWRIAPGDLALARKWIPGAEITVAPTAIKKGVWPVTLTNTEIGERVAATGSKAPPK
jgi:hypothetical protein